VNYKTFNSLEELSSYFSEYLIKQLNSLNKKKIYLALSGGSTPQIYLKELAIRNHEVDWSEVYILQVDERCVPPEDKQSNYKMIKEILLDKINLPEDHFFRIKGENDPIAEAVNYGMYIKNENIVFDIVLLGMGSDGHTASVFPDQDFIFNFENITAVSVFPGSDQKRITITEDLLNQAKLKIFVVTGSDKAEKVYQIYSGNQNLPAAKINGDILWLLDKSAASLLPQADK